MIGDLTPGDKLISANHAALFSPHCRPPPKSASSRDSEFQASVRQSRLTEAIEQVIHTVCIGNWKAFLHEGNGGLCLNVV